MSRGAVQVQWRPTFVLCFHRVESQRYEHSIVVKGTAHTRLKEVRTKATVIALASFDVVKEDEEEQQQNKSKDEQIQGLAAFWQ